MSAMPSPLKSPERRIVQAHAAARRGRLECAVALAQEHADRAVVIVDRRQVGQAVAVEVANQGLRSVLARWPRSAGAKRAAALVQRTLTLLPP